VTAYLELPDYLLIAERVLGLPAEVIANFQRIELAASALAAPKAGFGGIEAYPDFATKAAVLCYPNVLRIAKAGADVPARDGETDQNASARGSTKLGEGSPGGCQQFESQMWRGGREPLPLAAAPDRHRSKATYSD
jgi:hypothetical protein